MPLLPLTPILPLLPKVLDWLWVALDISVLVLWGERLVAELAQAYLAEVSQRLRPGSYKSVRFALGLLGSHLGKYAVGDLSLSHGKEVLGYITQLSPNVRKYREGKDAGLVELASLSVASKGVTLAPQTQARILKQMSQFLDCVLARGSWRPTLGEPSR